MKLFNFFRFLIIQGEDVTPDITNKPYNIGPLIFIILAIIIIIMIISSAKKYKKDKKTVFLNFLIGCMIFVNIYFLTPESAVISPEHTSTEKVYQNYDYIINVIEETTKLKIIIETKTEIKELEFTIKFYDLDDKLLYGDSNKLTNLENGYYKTFEYNKPTEILLNGGKYNLSHEGYKNIFKSANIYIEWGNLMSCIMYGIILGTIVAIITQKIKKADEEDENFPYLCTKCNTINHKNNRFCSKCGNKLTNINTKICNNCNTENPKENHFCINCGSELKNLEHEEEKSNTENRG